MQDVLRIMSPVNARSLGAQRQVALKVMDLPLPAGAHGQSMSQLEQTPCSDPTA